MKKISLICSILLFLLWCASLAYWGIYFTTPPTRKVTLLSESAIREVALSDAESLFGGAMNHASSLPFFLKGVIVSTKSDTSLAIIGAAKNTESLEPKQRFIQPHAEIIPGVTLQEVYTTHIVVSDHGLRRELPLSTMQSSTLLPNSTRVGATEMTRGEALGPQSDSSRTVLPVQ